MSMETISYIGALQALGALATEAQAEDEGEVGASSFGSDGSGKPSGSDSDSRFVCINNNDNTVTTGANEDNGGETDQCAVVEACFEKYLGEDFETLTMALENGQVFIINGQEVTLNNFEDICERYLKV